MLSTKATGYQNPDLKAMVECLRPLASPPAGG